MAQKSSPPPEGQQWALNPDEGTITTPQGLTFTHASLDATIFMETFIQETHYEQPDMRGPTVVDAGAFVGDTALYFANMGAEVYSYEPDPTNFDRLQQNLQLNPCGARVHAFRKAVGIDGLIPFRFGHGGGSEGYLSHDSTGDLVESVSLDSIVQALPSDPFLLKADIKGGEYSIVRQPALERFQRLQIEYNGGHGEGLPFLQRVLASRGFKGIVYNPSAGRSTLAEAGMLRMCRTSPIART